MGCSGSKASQNAAVPVTTGDAQVAKTLLTTEVSNETEVEPSKNTKVEASKDAEVEATKDPEVECKSCGIRGRDMWGKRCACSHGQALLPPSVPLRVVIMSARALRNADCVLAGKSDPYCICEVFDQPESRFETHVVAEQLNPEWNHEMEIKDYCVGRSIKFTIKDRDVIKEDDFLGSATLTADQLFLGFDGEIPLEGAGTGVHASLRVKVAVIHPKVRVTVVNARALRNADWIGKSDPYCVCEIAGKPDSKFATTVVNDALNPVWKHEAEVVGYQIEDALAFTVKDKDPLKPDDILGRVVLPCTSFLEDGFEGELQLVDTESNEAAFLTVKVELGAKHEQVDVDPALLEEEDNETSVKDVPEHDESKTKNEMVANLDVVPADITMDTHSHAPKSWWCC